MRLVAVTVNVKRLSHLRPTESQMERLIQIFGCRPRWFKDGLPREKFG
jgi:hypothetical protein